MNNILIFAFLSIFLLSLSSFSHDISLDEFKSFFYENPTNIDPSLGKCGEDVYDFINYLRNKYTDLDLDKINIYEIAKHGHPLYLRHSSVDSCFRFHFFITYEENNKEWIFDFLTKSGGTAELKDWIHDEFIDSATKHDTYTIARWKFLEYNKYFYHEKCTFTRLELIDIVPDFRPSLCPCSIQ